MPIIGFVPQPDGLKQWSWPPPPTQPVVRRGKTLRPRPRTSHPAGRPAEIQSSDQVMAHPPLTLEAGEERLAEGDRAEEGGIVGVHERPLGTT
jgi:hypothetical protein